MGCWAALSLLGAESDWDMTDLRDADLCEGVAIYATTLEQNHSHLAVCTSLRSNQLSLHHVVTQFMQALMNIPKPSV